MEYTRKLSDFCQSISFAELPPEVIHMSKLCLLDYVANVYGSLELQAVTDVISYFKSLGGQGKAAAHGCGFHTDVHSAAFINGTTAEAIEAQDGYRYGGSHPGVAVIPAVLGVAEILGKNGCEVIEALVAGYEAANRVASAGHPWQTLSGFLPTGTCGTFGAAAAVARLREFDADTYLNAVSLAGYLTPICMAEQLMGGFTVKMVQGGQAASAGILAAGLAAQGISGTPYVLEGTVLNGGFCQITTGGKPNYEKLITAFGKPYSIMDVYFKPFTACRHTHGSAQAVLMLMQKQDINPEEIEVINVFTYGIAKVAVGKGVTDSVVSAQFSIPYVVSACLLDGELGPRQLTEKRMSDPLLMALSNKVKVEMDEELNAVYPDKTSSRVEIILRSGKKLIQQIDIPLGDPRDPLDAEDLKTKLFMFAGERSPGKTEQIINMIMNLEQVEDISELARLI